MGRAPCCDKANVKKGPWAPEEDATLKAYIEEHGTGGNWIALPQKIGLKRCGKSCRLRWLNYLRPNIKHGGFSEEEDRIICSLYVSIGSRWSIIASQLPGRTDNDIKNYWNTRLKKKLFGKQRKDQFFCGKKDLLMKKGRSPTEVPSSIIVSGNENMNNQDPYLPDQLPVMPPMPYCNQEPRRLVGDDHTSIRKLLIMLGGKFSSDDNVNESINMVSQFSNGNNTLADLQESTQNQDQNFIPCSTHVSSSSSSSSPIMLLNSIQQGQNGIIFSSSMFDQDMCYSTNPQQKVDGFEFLCADMCEMNTSGSSSVITCGDNMDWGDQIMNSLISTTTTNNAIISLSNYQRPLQQEASLHDLALDDDRNRGVH